MTEDQKAQTFLRITSPSIRAAPSTAKRCSCRDVGHCFNGVEKTNVHEYDGPRDGVRRKFRPPETAAAGTRW